MRTIDPRRRIRQLIAEIEKHRYAYYVLDDSQISDEAYDSLFHELEELERRHPDLIEPDSPTQRVGAEPLKEFKSVAHRQPMLSLNDVFSRQEVEAWMERISKLSTEARDCKYHLDIKMDGLACSLIYRNGRFVQAITRGDGRVGEDVTYNVKTISSVPLRLRADQRLPASFYKGELEVRGEIVIYWDDFRTLNEERVKLSQPPFKNPRNTAAGSVRQLDPAVAAVRRLRFHAYDLLASVPAATQSQEYRWLALLGFIVNKQHRLAEGLEKIMEYIGYWQSRRLDLPFNSDGLVIRVDRNDLFDVLGVVGRAPRGAVAFKYPPRQATSVVRDIIISLGRTGVVTPVAILDPVMVDGSLVQHASLHNEDEIKAKDIRIGDTVIVHKAGDIIPQIVDVLKDLRQGHQEPFDMSRALADQPMRFIRLPGEVAWRAVDLDNPQVLKRVVEHYASKEALDIEGLGKQNVALLVDRGLVGDLADIYGLSVEQLIGLERFAEVSAKKLFAAIGRAKNPSLARFLIGLGIRHVGTQTAYDLATHFGTLEKIASASYEELSALDGVGEIVAHSILEWFASDANMRLMRKLRRNGVKPQAATIIGGRLTDQKIAITGALEGISRHEAADMIRRAGGIFQPSVGRSTDYLVIGSGGGDSKRLAAKRYGTKVISAQQLQRLVDNGQIDSA